MLQQGVRQMPAGCLSDKVSGAPGFASLSRDWAFLLALKPQKQISPAAACGAFWRNRSHFI